MEIKILDITIYYSKTNYNFDYCAKSKGFPAMVYAEAIRIESKNISVCFEFAFTSQYKTPSPIYLTVTTTTAPPQTARAHLHNSICKTRGKDMPLCSTLIITSRANSNRFIGSFPKFSENTLPN